jgi:Ricin-type beta-trefoil lectin domain-like
MMQRLHRFERRALFALTLFSLALSACSQTQPVPNPQPALNPQPVPAPGVQPTPGAQRQPQTLELGAMYTITNRSSGKLLDLSGHSNAPGTLLTQWTADGSVSQHWMPVQDAYGYALKNASSGLVADVQSASQDGGAPVLQWNDLATTNQRLEVFEAGNGFSALIFKHSRKALDVSGGSMNNGAKVQQWEDNGTGAQQWKFTLVQSTPTTTTWVTCAIEGEQCAFGGTKQVRYGANDQFTIKTVSGGIACTNDAFGGDPIPNVAKTCSISAADTQSNLLSRREIEFFAGGEHQSSAGWQNFITGGTAPTSNFGFYPSAPSYFDWTYAQTPVTAVPSGALNRHAGVGYNQLYEKKGNRNASSNTRVKYGELNAQYFSKSQQKWIEISQQPVEGAAYPEDFKEQITPPVGSDSRNEGGNVRSVRAGSQASGDAGGIINRPLDDSSSTQRYNFHGFMKSRFTVDWSDVEAFVVQQWAGLVLNDPNGADDRAGSAYAFNVGLDFWDTLGSPYDGFQTHGGIGGGRFVQVGVEAKRYICYVGSFATLDKALPVALPAY